MDDTIQLELFRRPRPCTVAVRRFIGWLLWLANSEASSQHHSEWLHLFYRTKDIILGKFGSLQPDRDYQEIVYDCRGCNGGGIRYYGRDDAETCWRCSGTGVWERFVVLLRRWSIGGYLFHQPAGRVTLDRCRCGGCSSEGDDPRITIRGKIRHTQTGRAGVEAAAWLGLVFYSPLLRAIWRDQQLDHHFGWPLPPMMAIGRILRLAAKIREWCWELLVARCVNCKRKLWPWSRKYYPCCSNECIPF